MLGRTFSEEGTTNALAALATKSRKASRGILRVSVGWGEFSAQRCKGVCSDEDDLLIYEFACYRRCGSAREARPSARRRIIHSGTERRGLSIKHCGEEARIFDAHLCWSECYQ